MPGVTFVVARRSGGARRARRRRRPRPIIVEPIQGEGGVRPISPATGRGDRGGVRAHGRAADRRRSAERHRAGRARSSTAGRSASRRISIALGKALGARRAGRRGDGQREGRRRRSRAGDHGTTYGGNLLACRAALVVSRRARRRPAGRRSPRVGDTCSRGLRALRGASPGAIVDVRGAGLMAGLELDGDATPVVDGGARARLARQSHVDDRDAPAAAVHRDGAGRRRGDGDSGRRDRRQAERPSKRREDTK